MLLLHKAAFLQWNWCKPRFIHISSANHGGGRGKGKANSWIVWILQVTSGFWVQISEGNASAWFWLSLGPASSAAFLPAESQNGLGRDALADQAAQGSIWPGLWMPTGMERLQLPWAACGRASFSQLSISLLIFAPCYLSFSCVMKCLWWSSGCCSQVLQHPKHRWVLAVCVAAALQ